MPAPSSTGAPSPAATANATNYGPANADGPRPGQQETLSGRAPHLIPKRKKWHNPANAILGGENTEFYLTAQDKADSGAFGRPTVRLRCRYQGCKWGFFVAEMELWEFIADAREHWENEHGTQSPEQRVQDADKYREPPEADRGRPHGEGG